MTKKKAIVIAVVLALIMITLALFIFPLNGQDSFQIGNSNYDFYWISKSLRLGLDLEGGMYVVYEMDLEGVENPDQAVESTIANLESILASNNYTEATVTRQGSNMLRVEVPAVQNTETLMNLLGEPAELEFKDSEGSVLIEGSKHLEDAYVSLYNGAYAINLVFNSEGTTAFAEATQNNIGKPLSININGEEIMAPIVQSAITDGQAVITSENYTMQQAERIATQLRAGTFAVSLDPISIQTIGATLGEGALNASIIAALIGIAAIIIFMIVMYKGLGILASLALLIYSILMIYLLAIVPWVQLTLPSIAGVILSIGMAVDANVIIFERMRDERRLFGKPIATCVQIGFKKALTAIIDSNVTTIIGSIVLIILGSPSVQGFGITLLIGILLSMFTAIFITRLLVNISLAFNEHSDAFYGLRYELKVDENAVESDAAEAEVGTVELNADGTAAVMTGDNTVVKVSEPAEVSAPVKKNKGKKQQTYKKVRYKRGGNK
ncbi:MAG TPA: protein translocase subunit SecD [Candidatus Stercoripulliclostridium merdigallinarum]|uniref:Protein translocase subunit SecD n=1 Tax=Candidatus Stercoripulliclostridium merdigallinarum TaxID=2840951 RepID=A0A9D1SHU2_9FIRM|nr:protein translocase subunit SecD [Candidatus Stercoripulliclostridium merdigallinarum]